MLLFPGDFCDERMSQPLNSGDTYIYATFGKTARDSIVTEVPCHFGKPQMQVSFKKVREVLRKTEGSTQFFICRIRTYEIGASKASERGGNQTSLGTKLDFLGPIKIA